MLKIVVYDSGCGGELFADRLERELPIVEVIRVIDWRHAEESQSDSKAARNFAELALRPYIGKVDLIIFANYLLSITSLRHFRRKYKNQQFLGLNLTRPDAHTRRDVLILTTKPVTRTVNYYHYLFHIKRHKFKTLILDTWPAKIDDGELTQPEIHRTIALFSARSHLHLEEIVLAHANFADLAPELRSFFGRNLKIYDSFGDTIDQACKILRIRGGTGKKKK